MKKFFVAILISTGIVGLIFLTRFKTNAANPSTAATASTNTIPLNTSTPTTPNPTTSSTTATTLKDGAFTGQAVDVGYGVVEVKATISGGKLTAITYLSLPSGGHSSEVSSVAGPMLRSEALQSQSANVDIVSGATSTSEGFMQSLQSALSQAS